MIPGRFAYLRFFHSIVFVHGLNGDREQTWTVENSSGSWPEVLLPSRIPNARVLTYGYDAYVAHLRGVVSQTTIGNHGMNLLNALATFRSFDNTVSGRSITVQL